MKIEYMREFLELTETMNFSVASGRLFISQSTLSRHIQNLECELGYSLFKTSSHGIELTKSGELAIPSFRRIVKEYDSFTTQCANLNNQITGVIRIGILYYAMDDYFSEFMEYIEEKYPNVEFSVSSYQPQALFEDLRNGKMDVATLLWYDKSEYPEMRLQQVGKSRIIALMKKDHELSEKDTVTLEDLSFSKLVELKRDEYSNEITRNLLKRNNIRFDDVILSDNIETVPMTIRKYGGVHLTGESCRRQNASAICYKEIAGDNAVMSFGFMALKQNDNPIIDMLYMESVNFSFAR